MPDTVEKLVLKPLDLDWLATALKLDEMFNEKPALEKLLASFPSINLEIWPKGRDVLQEGERGDDFFVIYKGKLSVWHKGRAASSKQIGTLKPGDFFGEIGFLLKSNRSATVRTEVECRIFRIPADEFSKVLTNKFLERWIKQVACERLTRIFMPESSK
ncbi:MAG: cyclic nucleotide-binding domain-containing protein [Elusimicrobia bacterium]|nr:cyclic nucleotide-binding domain-containing protein [Elusimicrobiota bacterium]